MPTLQTSHRLSFRPGQLIRDYETVQDINWRQQPRTLPLLKFRPDLSFQFLFYQEWQLGLLSVAKRNLQFPHQFLYRFHDQYHEVHRHIAFSAFAGPFLGVRGGVRLVAASPSEIAPAGKCVLGAGIFFFRTRSRPGLLDPDGTILPFCSSGWTPLAGRPPFFIFGDGTCLAQKGPQPVYLPVLSRP